MTTEDPKPPVSTEPGEVHPRHLDSMIERYGVDVIVASHQAREAARLEEGRGYDLAEFRVLVENSSYAMSSVPAPAVANGQKPEGADPLVAT